MWSGSANMMEEILSEQTPVWPAADWWIRKWRLQSPQLLTSSIFKLADPGRGRRSSDQRRSGRGNIYCVYLVISYLHLNCGVYAVCNHAARSQKRSHHIRGGSYCNQCNPQSLSQAKPNDSIQEDDPSSASGFSKCEDHHQHQLKPNCSWDANWRSPLKSCTFAVRFRLREALTEELRV